MVQAIRAARRQARSRLEWARDRTVGFTGVSTVTTSLSNLITGLKVGDKPTEGRKGSTTNGHESTPIKNWERVYNIPVAIHKIRA